MAILGKSSVHVRHKLWGNYIERDKIKPRSSFVLLEKEKVKSACNFIPHLFLSLKYLASGERMGTVQRQRLHWDCSWTCPRYCTLGKRPILPEMRRMFIWNVVGLGQWKQSIKASFSAHNSEEILVQYFGESCCDFDGHQNKLQILDKITVCAIC